MLSSFTTDFSSDVAAKGESVTTRVATAMTNQDLTAGYTPGDVTSSAKTVTLDFFKGRVVAFTDMEVAKGTLDLLQRTFIRPAAHAVVKGFMDDLFALVLAGNFSQSTLVTAANWDADDLADLAQQATDAAIPKDDRFAILKPAYFASLSKDNSIQNSQAYGSNSAIVNNVVPRVHGFAIHEYADVPANAQALEGIAGNKQGLILAARVPAIPQNWYGEVSTVSDPQSGLTLQFRSWYDGNAGKQLISVGVIYGVQIGVTGNIIRIRSA